MVYDLLEMMEGVWVDGETLTRENYGDNFISQLADLISEVHTTDGIEKLYCVQVTWVLVLKKLLI